MSTTIEQLVALRKKYAMNATINDVGVGEPKNFPVVGAKCKKSSRRYTEGQEAQLVVHHFRDLSRVQIYAPVSEPGGKTHECFADLDQLMEHFDFVEPAKKP